MATVEGVKIVGGTVSRAPRIPFESDDCRNDVDCPVAAAAGLPVRVRKLPAPPFSGRHPPTYRIVRLMSRPETGIADLDWQAGGMLPPAPPVHMFRSDGVPFTEEDFEVLDDFEMEMLDDGPRRVTPEDWKEFAGNCSRYPRGVGGQAVAASCGVLLLEHKHPKGQRVTAHGLQTQELNGCEGVVAGGTNYTAQRVGVTFPAPFGLKALKWVNLESVDIEDVD